jgi:translocation and assembly module TamB
MSHSSAQNSHPVPQPNRRLWLIILKSSGITCGVLLLLGTIGVAWRLWNFAQNELAPLAAKTLTTALNRPVQLGKVTEIYPTGLKLAASSIPPTSTDTEQVSTDGVEVGFDIWQLLTRHRLLLDVTLINPRGYFNQDNRGSWLKTKIVPPKNTGPIKTVLDKIRFRHAKIVLVSRKRIEQATGTGKGNYPYPIPQGAVPVEFSDLSGTAKIFHNGRLLKIEVAGKASNGGDVFIQGDVRPGKTLTADLQVKAQELLAADVTHLIVLPVDLQQGRVNGDLRVQLMPNQKTLLYGNAGLLGVTLQVNRVPERLNKIQGDINFHKTTLQFDNLVSSYGKIPLIASGTIDTQTGFNVTGRVNAVSLTKARETLKIKFPVPTSGVLQANVHMTGGISHPVLSGHVASLQPTYIDKIVVKRLSSDFNVSTANPQVTLTNIKAQPTLGGEVNGGGIVKLSKIPQLDLHFTAQNIPGEAIAQLYKINLPQQVQIGQVAGTAAVTGSSDQIVTLLKWQSALGKYSASGETTVHPDRSVSFQDVAINVEHGVIRAAGNYLNQRWRTVASLSHVGLKPFIKPGSLQNISLDGANLNGDLRLAGISDQFKVTSIQPQGFGVQIAGGRVGVDQIQLQDKNLLVKLTAQGVHLGQILPKSLPVLQNPLSGNFIVAGNLDNFTPKTIRALGKAHITVGRGTVTATNLQLVDGHYLTKLAANNVLLGQLANVPAQVQTSPVTGEFNVAGTVDSFSPNTIAAAGVAQVNLPGGVVTANRVMLANGLYQANISTSHLKLNQFNPKTLGNLSANLQVTGKASSPKLTDINADGTVQFSKGVGGLNSPLNAAIAWNGEKLTISSATSHELSANGYILVNAQKPGIPEITQLNLHVQAQNYNLRQLPLKTSYLSNLSGTADFLGQVTGNLTKPNVAGKLDFHHLQVNNLAFDPILTGQVNLVSGHGLSLDLIGKRDRLAANFNVGNRPNSFWLKWQQAQAIGQANGDDWRVKVEQFPIQSLNLKLPPNIPLGKNVISGLLTGDFQVNQKTLAADGSIAIAKPEIGRIIGDQFSTKFRYNRGIVSINNSEFIKGKSDYTFDATLRQAKTGPQLKANLQISHGNIQDILNTAQIFQIQDLQRGLTEPTYGTAADLTTVPQGLPNQPLLHQIERLYEIDALLEAKQRQEKLLHPIPDLQDLKGTFDGSISLDTATANGLAAKFKLTGRNFELGRKAELNRYYHADRIVVDGDFTKGVLRFQPLLFKSEKKWIIFKGYISQKGESGQLRVKNFPIQILQRFMARPIDITGNLNANASLAGSLSNPQARGELEILDGTINHKKLESATASFNYDAGRLSFSSRIAAKSTEPMTVVGYLPYKFPFASVAPDSNRLNLIINVKNAGLVLLNLLTDQVAFESGAGEVNLVVGGTLKQPLVKGIASLKQAVFWAQALPEKITNVSGKAEFDFNKIVVDNLKGTFSSGEVTAFGEIPIFFAREVKINHPLSVNLEKLALNLKELYQGGASGNLQITGSLIRPVIGGQIELFNGKVLLADSTDSDTSSTSFGSLSPTTNKQNSANTNNTVPRLNHLKLDLGKNLLIARQPVLLFQASGGLIVNGTVTEPIPEGTISLTKGGVNLFTTQFKLASGYEQTATFSSYQPRDPDLDIHLVTKVVDAVQQPDVVRQNTNAFSSLETIRVEASIYGPASRLNDNLELTSSPVRSQTELVTLLGGGFNDTQGRSDSDLGIINVAGSAVLNNFQGAFNEIANSLGLSELRIFPTIINSSPTATRNSSTIELALEAGIDLSPKFSFSTIKILTDNDPFQFGINYRIDDHFRARASTNLVDDSRAVIEYQTRF